MPSTTLFTPAVDSDFLVTIYLSALPVGANGPYVCFQLQWTDESGLEQANSISVLDASQGGGFSCRYGAINVVGLPNQVTQVALPIHVIANTSVAVSTVPLYNNTAPKQTPTYNLHISVVNFPPTAVVTVIGSPQQPLTQNASGDYVALVKVTNTGNVTVWRNGRGSSYTQGLR